MSFGDDDLAYMLGQDFGVDVTYSGTTVDGQLDEVTDDMLPGVAVAQAGLTRSVLVATGSVSPVSGASIIVDGMTYTVYDARKEGPDGRLTRVFLAG